MVRQSKRELVEALRPGYRKGTRIDKGRILDQVCAATGYNRKYAVGLFGRQGLKPRPKRKRGRRRLYDQEVVAALVQVWEASGYLCAKRLQPFLPEFLEALERHHQAMAGADVREKLLRMSAATMDRRLQRARSRLGGRGRTTTKPGSLLKQAIPIRTFADWDQAQPGFLEMDLVAHCGETTAGEYLHTLSAIDVDTRWFEPVALPNRGQKATFEGIQAVRRQLPFPLLGIDCDSGGEFINHHLYAYCLEQHITFTRSRPFHKNDQAYVEQKNWSGVRQIVGYERYESPQALAALRAIYADLRLWVNFFQPVMKLQSKVRVASKLRKTYDRAQTPYRRAMASAKVTQHTKHQLTQLYLSLHPVQLRQRLETNLDKLWRLSR